MKIGIKIAFQGIDKDGNLLDDKVECEGNSWIIQYFTAFWAYTMNGNTYVTGQTTKDTGGTTRTANMTVSIIFNALAGNADGGIMVGTGNTAVALADYALATKIAHGTSANQLQYGTHSTNTITGTTTLSWIVTRAFTNSSGGNITIAETGIGHDTSYNFLIERSVLASTYTVNNGAACVCTYTFTFTLA